MSKITSGLVAVFAMILVVTGVGFALFSDSVSVTGLSVSTATPGLLISPYAGEPFAETLDASLLSFTPLVPGESDWGEFWLKNTSDGGTDVIDMVVTGQLLSATGDWASLKDAVKLRFCVYDESAELKCDVTMASDWYTLMEWYDAAMELPGTLEQDAEVHYAVNLMIPDTFGNEIAGKTVSDIEFEFVGTQVVE